MLCPPPAPGRRVPDGPAVFLAGQPLGLIKPDGRDGRPPWARSPPPVQVVGILGLQQLHQPLKTGLHLHQVGERSRYSPSRSPGRCIRSGAGPWSAFPRGRPALPRTPAHTRPPWSACRTGETGPERPFCRNSPSGRCCCPPAPAWTILGVWISVKPPGQHLLVEGPAHRLLNFEHAALAQVAQHHRPQGQLGVQVQVEFILLNGHAHRLRGAGQDLNFLQPQLHPHGGPLVLPQGAGDHHRTLLLHSLQQLRLFCHALQRAVRSRRVRKLMAPMFRMAWTAP